MAVLLPALAGVLGAVVGSFLNVVIHRVPAGLSVVRPPSACPVCSSPVRAYDNVPVLSWLVLRAKCRDCGAPISARYPLVELGTAAAFVVVAAMLGPQLVIGTAVLPLIAELVVLLALLYLAAVSIALAAIDLDVHRLPNSIVLPTYLVGGVTLTVAAISTGDLVSLARAAAGAGILFAFYLVLALIAPRGMGMGDVKLAGVLGLFLGWFGWEALAVGALAAFLLGGLYGVILILARRARRTTGIPFGPWMLAGAWLGILFGEPIARGYLAVFGLE
ncbi:MAG: prepilin peptidase [Microcella pacifica]|uniref:Prepilin leader peptidase/N-methyltransferase n=1 Tax=Microcella pacifica TaxID=2591847 RepID=A0A9E5MKW8_9MICO|nr:A24 family peptidase [Microcella pacifica]MBR22657.1 prepilin peptidase [Leifsonia sp.]NHF63724.1 prepilin peptidase [Microcella pacifica]